MNDKATILITEEGTIFSTGLRVLLGNQPDLTVINAAVNGGGMLSMVAAHSPDLLITDIAMPNNRGIDRIVEIKTAFPLLRILLVTQHNSEQSIRDAFQAGASGYVMKDASNDELLTAVHSVLNGKVYLSPSLSDNIINAFLLAPKPKEGKLHLDTLTKREIEILTLVAEGHTNRNVANLLSLSIKTVEKHRSNMMKKLDLHNVSGLISFAIGNGLLGNSD
ncbi:MAG: response regulator [Gammaproteobacteria bacterium]|nr:response regulator [Gammaproteobacteria bacterium]